jgi:hypothetical protein
LLWLVPLDWHDPLFLQVDSLSFHLVQISPVTSVLVLRKLEFTCVLAIRRMPIVFLFIALKVRPFQYWTDVSMRICQLADSLMYVRQNGGVLKIRGAV